jgi:hypothetical protein
MVIIDVQRSDAFIIWSAVKLTSRQCPWDDDDDWYRVIDGSHSSMTKTLKTTTVRY